jgi:hypothetical protein
MCFLMRASCGNEPIPMANEPIPELARIRKHMARCHNFGNIIIAKGNASFLVTAKGRSRENPPRTLTPWSARARTALRPSANRPGSPYGLAPQFRLGVRGDFRPRGLLFAKHVIFRLVVTAVTPLISPSQTAYLRYQGARTGPKGEKRVPGLRCSAGPGPGFSHYRAFWVLRVTGAP